MRKRKYENHIKYENGKPIPKWVRCYEDKKNDVLDPYTVIFTKAFCWAGKRYTGYTVYIGGNASPQTGIGYHGEIERGKWNQSGCGSRIKFYDLPHKFRDFVVDNYQDNWEIKYPKEILDEMLAEISV